MDDDSVKDIFKLTETINVHKTDSQGVPIVLEKERKKTGESPANISKQVGQITISKRIHGSEGMEVEEGGQQVSRKKYSVEILYDKAKPVQPPGTDDSDDASDDDSDSSSSNSRCSSESEQSSKAMASNNDDDDASDIRYQGPVDGTRGTWLGVEWLTPNRGKHDGSKDGHQYFHCHQTPKTGPHGSFIRPVDRLVFGQTLLQAAKHRYIVDDLKELEDIPLTIDGCRGKIEAVGLDKIAKQQSDLTSLTVLGLDSCRVERVGSDECEVRKTGELLKNVCSLSLANNFLTNWADVEDILGILPNLESLDISANHIFSPITISCTKSFQIDTLRINTMPMLT
ncbi:hypothetical protein FB639_003694, partial [Coemansia asiatica]